MTMAAQRFACDLMVELCQLDARAAVLEMKVQKGGQVILGITDDEEFVPLLLLGAGSAKFNKMMLSVNHQGYWQPTFQKGTPKMLAELLAGELNHLWTIPVAMIGFNFDAPPQTK